MADTLQFDLVSPEKKLASVAATMVELPGTDGDLAALPNHAPVLTTLRPGVVRVHADGSITEYIVTGGVAEIAGEGTSVLAEAAMDRSEITRETIDGLVAETSALVDGADELTRTALSQRINDLNTLIGDLGL